MNFSSMRLSFKLILGFAVTIIFAICIGVFGIIEMAKVNEADTRLFEKGAVPLGDMVDIATGFQRVRVNIRDIARSTDVNKIQTFENRIDEIEKEMKSKLTNIEKTIMTQDGKELYAELLEHKQQYFESIKNMADLAKLGKSKELLELMDGSGFVANKEFQESLDNLVSNKKQAASDISDENSNTYKEARVLIITLLALGALIAFVVAFSIIKNITGALNKISALLGDASGQVASASDQLSGASQSLSNASSEQASSIEETSASLEEMNGMIENNLKNAEKAKELADDVRGIADKGNESMSELIKSMQEILEANTNIEKLVKVIGEIGDKTKVIDEIVFQTKLLSFNASVEAERAGEHGRGFAVVAQEVGNLAQMSGKAALEISAIVKDSIKNAEQITTDNKKKVEKGNDLVKDTATLLKETTEKANTVSGSATQVVDASKEQAAGIRQISNAMDQLNKATQQNAATAEEAASSSEELAAQAETMNGLVSELNELVKGKGNVVETLHAVQKVTRQEPPKKSGVVRSEKMVPKQSAPKEKPATTLNGNQNHSDEWEQL